MAEELCQKVPVRILLELQEILNKAQCPKVSFSGDMESMRDEADQIKSISLTRSKMEIDNIVCGGYKILEVRDQD